MAKEAKRRAEARAETVRVNILSEVVGMLRSWRVVVLIKMLWN